jgi:predicted TIM-barrel fold metal-dependent hydrolase
MTEMALTTRRARRESLGIIDVDIHPEVTSPQELDPYLPPRFRGRGWGGGHGGISPGLLQGFAPRLGGNRLDAIPRPGLPAGSDPDFLREQHLDGCNIVKGVMHPIHEVLRMAQTGDLGRALARACNEWIAEKWIPSDDRLWAGITIPVEDPVGAVEEIERWADHPRFLNATFTAITREPLGDAKYWPIYEALVDRGMPVVVHAGGWSGTAGAPGWPAYWIEFHACIFMSNPAQVTSLVYSGVFDRFPTMQVVLEEGGIAWLPALMARLDRAWEELHEDTTHLQERPSEIIRRHFWFSTQPLEQPDKPHYLGQLLDQIDMDDRIVYASDYPHWDCDDPMRILPPSEVGAERREKILSRNAEPLFAWTE